MVVFRRFYHVKGLMYFSTVFICIVILGHFQQVVIHYLTWKNLFCVKPLIICLAFLILCWNPKSSYGIVWIPVLQFPIVFLLILNFLLLIIVSSGIFGINLCRAIILRTWCLSALPCSLQLFMIVYLMS